MCVGGGGRSYPQPQRPEFEDSPPVVTGMQTGVENPKDTKKATEELKIRRQKKEGTYVDPNLAAVEERLTRSGSSRSNLTKQQQAGRVAARNRAKDMARARLKRNLHLVLQVDKQELHNVCFRSKNYTGTSTGTIARAKANTTKARTYC